MKSPASTAVAFVAPAILLVFLSSTSFIAARAIAPHADPVLFLFVRFVLVVAIFAFLARNVEWPRGRHFVGHFLAGAVINGLYLIGSFWAVANGLAASVMTLLASLQPFFIALVSVIVLRKAFAPRTWFGLLLGFAGVALVLSPRLTNVNALGLPALPVAIGILSIIALAAGTMVQKTSLATADLRALGAVQHLGATSIAAAALVTFGTLRWDGAPELWLSLVWSVLGLSIAGTSLFIWMVRRGEATLVTALMLLVPPATAIQAWLLFDDRLSFAQVLGFAFALAGIAHARQGGAGIK